jgi:hypothetical protein
MEQFKFFTFKTVTPLESESGRFGSVCIGLNDSDDVIVVDLEWQKDSVKPFICGMEPAADLGFSWDKWNVCEEDVEEYINNNWRLISQEADKEGYTTVTLG